MNTPEASQTLGKALEAARDYADALVKGALSEFGGILSDTIGYWRLKNRVRLMLKAKRWLEEKGVQPGKLLPDVFVPLLEDGGNVEDETLADMFASLLAGHLDPAQQDEVHPSYSKVLTQLSPLDAKLMLAFGYSWYSWDTIPYCPWTGRAALWRNTVLCPRDTFQEYPGIPCSWMSP